eukprot:gene14203-biopygen1488
MQESFRAARVAYSAVGDAVDSSRAAAHGARPGVRGVLAGVALTASLVVVLLHYPPLAGKAIKQPSAAALRPASDRHALSPPLPPPAKALQSHLSPSPRPLPPPTPLPPAPPPSPPPSPPPADPHCHSCRLTPGQPAPMTQAHDHWMAAMNSAFMQGPDPLCRVWDAAVKQCND